MLCYYKLLAVFSAFLPVSGASAEPALRISVDAAQVTGKLKAVNDVENGPLCERGIVDLSSYYQQLGIRNVRLHDVPWNYDNVLDINYVFPNWEADPELAASYDFKQTDFYLKTITALNINIIFRLGYSAEYKTAVRHSAPPVPLEKWVNIVVHVIRHYNQGWANGHHMNIRYWEVWNEPDGDSLVFWSGSRGEFYRLYEMTARAIKALDPALKVGGPGLAGDLSFLEGMLKYCRDRQAPLDFASWHVYTQDPHWVARQAQSVHDLLAQYGFGKAESILDEWNYGPNDWKKLFVNARASREYFDATQDEFGAAFDTTVFTELQDVPIDIATYYSGTTFMWGLFTSSGAPQKAYYAFLAFHQLLDSPHRVAVECTPTKSDISAVAGLSEDKHVLRILMSNLSREKKTVTLDVKNLPWNGAGHYQTQVINRSRDLDVVSRSSITGPAVAVTEELDGPSVALITVQAGK